MVNKKLQKQKQDRMQARKNEIAAGLKINNQGYSLDFQTMLIPDHKK